MTVPRYVPGRALPPYAHRPGRTPHPRTDPAGHSCGAPEACAAERLTPQGWTTNERYLFGFDLYNHRYWWESHEEWEELWLLEEPGTSVRQLLQGLIQVSAAMVKWEVGNRRGLVGLSGRGLAHLRAVAGRQGSCCYLGLDLERLVGEVGAFVAAADGDAQPPPMRLSL